MDLLTSHLSRLLLSVSFSFLSLLSIFDFHTLVALIFDIYTFLLVFIFRHLAISCSTINGLFLPLLFSAYFIFSLLSRSFGHVLFHFFPLVCLLAETSMLNCTPQHKDPQSFFTRLLSSCLLCMNGISQLLPDLRYCIITFLLSARQCDWHDRLCVKRKKNSSLFLLFK